MGKPIETYDTRFVTLIDVDQAPLLLHNDSAFTEGPVWFADLQCLLWSDIPNNVLRRWTPDGQVSLFRANSRNTNGNTRDRQGRLVSAEHSGRRISRTEADGSITVIADRFEGKKLNSPNDVVVKSDGSVWFTDPAYGLPPGAVREQRHDNVYRVDPISGTITAVASDFQKPNGLAFTPDEQFLFVADSAVSHDPNGNSHIRRFRVNADSTLSGGEVFVTTDGIPDGFRFDTMGNLWTSAGAGVNVYAADATWLGRIHLPADVTNLTFGGADKDHVFITGSSFLYSVRVKARGAQWP
ncbi:MAG TPA: SMP-30/gluconolactonase/LRE family protein [Devosia sp.]|nr:SMP-30/gluconolactonase/LRE family protein [Devosia sp.]